MVHACLTYWSGQGNAEIIRLMMAACGEPWIDTVPLDGMSHTTTPIAPHMQMDFT